MNNHIFVNGQRIELTNEQADQIKASFNNHSTKLADISVGDTFKIGSHEFIVLEHSRDTTAVISKDPIHNTMKFGTTNNYDGSTVDSACNKFEKNIAAIIGEENLIQHTVDLTSDDGLKDYGKVRRKMSLLTTDLYRRYVEILDKYNPKKWWWLATAFSTKRHNDTTGVKCVSPSGCIGNRNYFVSVLGVRPFCILKSNIFVSQ